jgi:undecaprenyl phosphate-alpha-L-ara4N flippase subunit ArnE
MIVGMAYLFVALTVVFTVLGQYFQKLLADERLSVFAPQQWTDYLALLLDRYLWGTLASLGLAMLFWLMALRDLEVSLAYPLLAINYVAMMVLATRHFGETIPPVRWLGVLAIIVGIVLMGSSDWS